MSCCPPKTNTDPRRNIPYCKPTPSRSEPLSHAEYLRKLKANNTTALSSPNKTLQVGLNTPYPKTIWTQTEQSDCLSGQVLPPVPEVHPRSTALEAGLTTMMEGAAAARGTLSKYDTTNHGEWNTTYRRQGLAIIQDTSYKAPAGGERAECTICTLSGTSSNVVPGNPTCCHTS